jgi:hypothetical protein
MKLRRALIAGIATVLFAVPPILGATLWLQPGSITIFDVPAALPIREASIEIKPDSLEKKSEGPPVTVFIEAAGEAFDVGLITIPSVRLCLDLPLCDDGASVTGKPKVDDADSDGLRDLKVTFDRGEVLAFVADVTAPATVEFVVSGLVMDGTAFAAVDAVKLVDPEPVDPAPSPSPASEVVASPTPAMSEVPGATSEPSPEPSAEPGIEPSAEPSAEPSVEPTAEPSPERSVEPTAVPTLEPAPDESSLPTLEPSPEPTAVPSEPATGG